jgi:hypothetical protein
MTTVDELVDQVRSQMDEEDTSNLSDREILDALNRAQNRAAAIFSREYEQFFWNSTTITTTAGTSTYDIPSDAFNRVIKKLEVEQGSGNRWEIRAISPKEATLHRTSGQVSVPSLFTLTKNTIEIFPKPTGGVTIHVHYTKAPHKLVKSQGRISSYDATNERVIVDTLGDDISTSTTGFNSYINVIDYTTGDIKATLQVSAINTTTKQVSFKTASLTRSTVLGRTIATALPSDISEDDYLAVVTGTCVPEVPGGHVDYLIQHAVVELRRRFGESVVQEIEARDNLETELKKTWAGRPLTTRVRNANPHWKRNNVTPRRRR